MEGLEPSHTRGSSIKDLFVHTGTASGPHTRLRLQSRGMAEAPSLQMNLRTTPGFHIHQASPGRLPIMGRVSPKKDGILKTLCDCGARREKKHILHRGRACLMGRRLGGLVDLSIHTLPQSSHTSLQPCRPRRNLAATLVKDAAVTG